MTKKHTSTTRLYPMSDSAIDIKARKRVAELYELTDEIINASNEINETYANKIYRKYKQLIAVNKKLKKQLSQYHCPGCKCIIPSNEDVQQARKEEEEEDYHNDDDNESFIIIAEDQEYQSKQKPSTSFLTTHSLRKQSRKNKNPYIISDIEDTENFEGNDSRFTKTTCDSNDNDCHKDNDGNNINDSDSMKDGDNEDRLFIAMDQNENETTKDDNQSEHEIQEEVDKDVYANEEEDDETTCLPVILQDIIRQKAKKNNNARSYLLNIPLYPALCEFLCDKSYTSFNRRPSGTQIRPLIENHLSQNLANDAKIRMRLCDELREIHRSYMRTFMTDPHASRNKYISS
ncbi:unnamed protein product [Rotaria sordida]|uniref:Uncharacterized protein n=1 Tax=Rotaria sordida TaxID=392033 RepID=A0A815PV56_9BILA|nr:unnamed protein product [Rotaria sordida]CAF1453749.1 unnamed protein product [Rotaria sordida]